MAKELRETEMEEKKNSFCSYRSTGQSSPRTSGVLMKVTVVHC